MRTTVRFKSLAVGTIYRLAAIGFFLSILPLFIMIGCFSLFGMGFITVNGEKLTGVPAFVASPLAGLFAAIFSTGFGGTAMAFGLWMFSRFSTLKVEGELETQEPAAS